MKVLIIHTEYQYKGGEDTVVAEEIKLLQTAGVEVELLTFDNCKNVLLKLLQLLFNWQSYSRTKSKLAVFRPDIVHIHNLHFGGSASVIYAIKRSKVPFVITIHNFRLLCPSGTLFFNGQLFLDSLQQQFPWKAVRLGVYKNSKLITFWLGLAMFIHRKIETWKIPNRYIVLSEHAKQLFQTSQLGLSAKQIVIKPNFVSVSVQEEKQRSDAFLYLGRLSEEKGVMLLLSVFSSCQYKIKIAGDGPLKEEVQRYSSKYPNIEFLGILHKKEVYTLMQTCSALVFPSVWFEGMPLTIIEAFANSLPVLASKLGTMETMIVPQYNGMLFEPKETNLMECLEKWFNFNEGQKYPYYKNARKTYEDFYTAGQNLKQLLSIYNEVINEEKNLNL